MHPANEEGNAADLLWHLQQLAQQGNFERLRQLRDEIVRLLDSDDASNADLADTLVAGNDSFEIDRSTLSSSAPTLYESGRSTPQGSIASDQATAIDAYSTYNLGGYYHEELPHRPVQPTSTHLWPTYPSTNRRNTPQPCLRLETLRKAHDESPLVGHPPNSSSIQASGLAKLNHFCTFCYELGKFKIIKTKQDWKRHQEDYHAGTGNEWHCQYKDCNMIFYQGLPFKQHLKKDHNGQVFPRDCKEVRQQVRVYACGFENCRELNYTWKAFCDHVSTHMQKGHTAWSYDRTIRNLLKQNTIAWTWKEVYNDLGPRFSVLQSQLTWDPRNTREMKQKLEYLQFGSSLEAFLREVFFAGSPQPSMPAPTTSPLSPLPFPPPPPAIASGTFRNTPTSFGNPLQHVELDSSLPQAPSFFGSAQPMTEEVPTGSSGYRNSYSMSEAPPLSDYESQGSYQCEEIDAAHELLSVEQVLHESILTSCNPTPPLPPPSTAHDNTPASDSKKSCHKRIMSKSRGWLHGRRSQQSFGIEQSGIPPNTRMPTSYSKRATSTYPTAGLYCNQI